MREIQAVIEVTWTHKKNSQIWLARETLRFGREKVTASCTSGATSNIFSRAAAESRAERLNFTTACVCMYVPHRHLMIPHPTPSLPPPNFAGIRFYLSLQENVIEEPTVFSQEKFIKKGPRKKFTRFQKFRNQNIFHEILSNFDEFLCPTIALWVYWPSTGAMRAQKHETHFCMSIIAKNTIRELDAAQHNAGEHSCYFAH